MNLYIKFVQHVSAVCKLLIILPAAGNNILKTIYTSCTNNKHFVETCTEYVTEYYIPYIIIFL